MTVRAGDIVTVAGHTVLQRLQTQGLTNAKIPVDTVREIGNNQVVDKVPTEPDFAFSMESLSVDCSIEAILHGKVSTGSLPSQGAGQSDANGTEYPWATSQMVNITSPWKDPQSFSSGNVVAGHLLPGYFPQKMSYKFGVTENAQQTCELRGGMFYYGQGMAPTEDVINGSAASQSYTTAEPAVQYRIYGVQGTTFKNALGVLVNGNWMVQGEDYIEVSGGGSDPGSALTIQFTGTTIHNGDAIRVAYFTSNAHAYPDSIHESQLVLPGAVRGRNICLSIASGGAASWQRLYGIQTFTLDASFDLTPERELCNDELIGFTVNGTDCTGTVTMHAKSYTAFFSLLQQITGVTTAAEVVGWLNVNPVALKIEIQNPANAGQVLKTLFVPDGIFDIPATPVRVNQVVDFSFTFESLTGTYSAYKGSTNVI
jgi:hypothetical protein